VVARSHIGVWPLEIFYPVKLSLGAKLITDPNPFIAETLNSLKNPVVKQVREKAFWGRQDVVGPN